MEGFGMFSAAGNAVALAGVRMAAQVSGAGVRTVVEQLFVNREAAAIEAVYTFALPDGAAVCGFEAVLGDRVLTGVVEEMEKGLETYNEAVEAGDGAFLAEQWRPDVFSTRVGNLKAQQAVLIRLTYVAEAAVADREMRLRFPTTIAPRYGSSAGMDRVAAAVEADALNPPHVLAVPYGLDFSATVDVGAAVKAIGSATHGVTVSSPAGGEGAWMVRLSKERIAMDQDLVLTIELAREPAARARLEAGLSGDEHFVAVDFLPTFSEEELAAERVGAREVVFVLDCSGSMAGSSIEQARRALGLCLKSLNEGDRFNICRFGSTHEWLRPGVVVYGQETLDAAMRYLGGVQADLGGTEMYGPLEEALRGANGREVVLLTDGQVSNEPAIVEMAKQQAGRARVFTFGIGSAPSAFLINGLAQATGGAAEFIAEGERIEEKVLRTFARMNSPRLEEVTVDFGPREAVFAPGAMPALFDGDYAALVARVGGSVPPHTAVVTAKLGGRVKTWKVPVFASGLGAEAGKVGVIGARWVRRRLLELETARDGEGKRAAAALSKRYGVLSKETVLVAVEHRSVAERTSGMPALRRVPVMLAEGWGGVNRVAGGAVLYDAATVPAPVCAAPMSPPAAKAGGFFKRRARGGGSDAVAYDAKAAFSLEPGTRDAAGPQQAEADPLTTLLLRQTAAGDFAEDPLLRGAAINGQAYDGDAWRKELGALGVSPAAVTTALTLAALQRCFADKADLWRPAFKKALRWLEKYAPAAKAWVEAHAAAVKA